MADLQGSKRLTMTIKTLFRLQARRVPSGHGLDFRVKFGQSCACKLFRAVAGLIVVLAMACSSSAAVRDEKVEKITAHGLNWLAGQQSRIGHWTAARGQYPTAMTAMAGTALLLEGSTSTQGKYAPNIRQAVNYLISRSRPNGLIGDPQQDDRYTYGHGFSMLFLSQVLGEEQNEERRQEIIKVLNAAVEFSGRAQTKDGGWGYVSAKDGGGFDEGSTTITQVQGLRGCRNAGIAVPKEVIDKAIAYIRKCTSSSGGVQYSLKGGGERPAITAAAIACLFNAGEYDSELVPKMLNYAEKHLGGVQGRDDFHWHYAHYYYSQVMYREGDEKWEKYRDKIYARIISEASDDGQKAYWGQGYIGAVYTTASNLTILQLEKATLPIYQR